MYMSPNSARQREVTNTIKQLTTLNDGVKKLKNSIRKANDKLEKNKNNSSSKNYKNLLKTRDGYKNRLKNYNQLRKDYLSLICSQNMINELNKRIKFGENFLKCPSRRPEIPPHMVRELNRVLKKDVNDLRNELRRANSKRASTSGRN